MNTKHHLLILSQHDEIYKQLIACEQLPGLLVSAVKEPIKIVHTGEPIDIIFGEPSLISEVLPNMPAVHWVQSTWAGVEPLLVPGMRQDYQLTNARNVYGQAMVEYVFGYLLMIERKILVRWQSQLTEKWDNRPNGTLREKTLGLLGVGSIGSQLANTAHDFGMQVFGYTRQSEDCPAVDRYFHGEELTEFACGLDYLVCCLPGTPATFHLINEGFLSSLPPKAWLLNIGRGSTIDETALIRGLSDYQLAGAVLDVNAVEPLPAGHPLWSTPNTYLTFHSAAQNYPPDIAKIFIENYRRSIEGKPLLYQVDFIRGY
ncbi:MAG: D-2-hydroxyacid dehydrogenase [Anaerolineae bacterium]|nr:D-2-hydroxyacid dehydrogenase [Anaerolineae bacterium]